jgi:hypothetical protein
MKKLDEAMRRFAFAEDALAPPSARKRDERRQQLIDDLRKISEGNAKLAWLIVACLLALFLASLGFVLFCGDLSYAKIAIGLLGVSAAGSVRWLKDLWSEKSASELVARLIPELDGDNLIQVIEALLKKTPGRLRGGNHLNLDR